MSIDEQIKILQAYKNGKSIEIEVFDNGYYLWVTLNADKDYTFDFRNNNYRIKQEPKMRPYKNMREYVQAAKEHGLYIIRKNAVDSAFIPTAAHKGCVTFSSGDLVDYNTLLNVYEWQDGSPCGVEED